jgi:AraC-like DNA-binding protein
MKSNSYIVVSPNGEEAGAAKSGISMASVGSCDAPGGAGSRCQTVCCQQMTYREIEPMPCLRPFVDRFWVQTGSAAGQPGQTHRVLPDGCIDLIMGLDGEAKAKVVGTMTRAVEIPALGAVQLAAVRFRPGGAAPMLGIIAEALTDRTVPLEQLGIHRKDLGALGCAEPRSTERGIVELQRWLLARLPMRSGPDPGVRHAVSRLFSAIPPTTQGLAQELGWSRQHLRRRFLREVGIGPKEFARIARMQRAIAYLPGCPFGLADAAVHLGYFDQAHLARDLRLLAGVSATAVRADPGSIFPIWSLLAQAQCDA